LIEGSGRGQGAGEGHTSWVGDGKRYSHLRGEGGAQEGEGMDVERGPSDTKSKNVSALRRATGRGRR
jgi:hypothetical protein